MPPGWEQSLGLSARSAPEYIKRGGPIPTGSYSREIAVLLGELDLAGVFCVGGVPTLAFATDVHGPAVDELHAILWNQGLVGALVIVNDDTVAVLSLDRQPRSSSSPSARDERLVETLSLVTDGPTLANLLERVEAGTYWRRHRDYFGPEQRIDMVLLANIAECERRLAADIGTEAAQALIMQTIFVAYLEDRGIMPPSIFSKMSAEGHASFAAIMSAGDLEAFYDLFIYLKGALNGNVFTAPGLLDDGEYAVPSLTPAHLATLAVFRTGFEDMATGQRRFFGYDFRYIPIGLISAVYDRFLATEGARRSADGAFYTPMFLADMVVDQCWTELGTELLSKGAFLDPACGSGIFLVRLFQRVIDQWRSENPDHPVSWQLLVDIAERLHGGDINRSAVRIAAFSLYIAMLEQMDPPDLVARIRRGSMLPILYLRTLRHEDFLTTTGPRYDVILGNPPWRGRPGGGVAAAVPMLSDELDELPVPEREIAWTFVWTSMRRLRSGGLMAFLLPAMGFLHNTKPDAISARVRLFTKSSVLRVINMADMSFQLFDGAKRPTALIVLRNEKKPDQSYRFDYWCPKADLNLAVRRILTLSGMDRMRLSARDVVADPHLLKRRLWTRGPDERLLEYLGTIRPLSRWIRQFKQGGSRASRAEEWLIGQGFKPVHEDRNADPHYSTTTASELVRHPYLSARTFRALALPPIDTRPWPTSTVHRAGFVAGFQAPHVLIPQGVERADGRVRAAYSEQDLTFQHSLQAIAFPAADRELGKVLTAVLNSRLAAWFFFHESANLGTDRAKVLQHELLKLPFARPEDMPDPDASRSAASELARIVDRGLEAAGTLFAPVAPTPEDVDEAVYRYYGLEERDIALIDDAFDYLIPAMQPRASAPMHAIWSPSSREQRARYAEELCRGLREWVDVPIEASLAAISAEVAILRVRLTSGEPAPYDEAGALVTGKLLSRLSEWMHIPLSMNFQLTPDLRVLAGDDLFIVKPLRQRFWLLSAAIADVESIASDLQRTLAREGADHDRR